MQQNQFSRQSASQFGISNPSGLLNPAMSPTNPNLTIGDQFALMREMLPINEAITRNELAQDRNRRAEEAFQFQQEEAMLRRQDTQDRNARAARKHCSHWETSLNCVTRQRAMRLSDWASAAPGRRRRMER